MSLIVGGVLPRDKCEKAKSVWLTDGVVSVSEYITRDNRVKAYPNHCVLDYGKKNRKEVPLVLLLAGSASACYDIGRFFTKQSFHFSPSLYSDHVDFLLTTAESLREQFIHQADIGRERATEDGGNDDKRAVGILVFPGIIVSIDSHGDIDHISADDFDVMNSFFVFGSADVGFAAAFRCVAEFVGEMSPKEYIHTMVRCAQTVTRFSHYCGGSIYYDVVSM